MVDKSSVVSNVCPSKSSTHAIDSSPDSTTAVRPPAESSSPPHAASISVRARSGRLDRPRPLGVLRPSRPRNKCLAGMLQPPRLSKSARAKAAFHFRAGEKNQCCRSTACASSRLTSPALSGREATSLGGARNPATERGNACGRAAALPARQGAPRAPTRSATAPTGALAHDTRIRK
jgi:hypothetical protein